MKYQYKICMYYQFVPGDYEGSYYPGEDRLWLEILLDAYRDEYSSKLVFVDTIDANGFTVPLSLMELSEHSREEFAKSQVDKIAEHIAEMLERNNIEEYEFDEHSNEFKTIWTI